MITTDPVRKFDKYLILYGDIETFLDKTSDKLRKLGCSDEHISRYELSQRSQYNNWNLDGKPQPNLRGISV